MKRLQKELDDSEEQVEELEKAARSTLRIHEEEINTQNNKIHELTKKESDSASLNREVQQKEKENEVLKRKLAVLEKVRDESVGLKDELNSLTTENGDFKAENKALGTENEELKAELNALKAVPKAEENLVPRNVSPPKASPPKASPKRERGTPDIDARVQAMMNESESAALKVNQSGSFMKSQALGNSPSGRKSRSAIDKEEDEELARQNKHLEKLKEKKEKMKMGKKNY